MGNATFVRLCPEERGFIGKLQLTLLKESQIPLLRPSWCIVLLPTMLQQLVIIVFVMRMHAELQL